MRLQVNCTSYTTSELGSAVSCTVALSRDPEGQVVLQLATDTSEGRITSPASHTLTFDTLTWRVEQTVRVQGVEDRVWDGDVGYSLRLETASTAPQLPAWQSLSQSVQLVNTDVAFPAVQSVLPSAIPLLGTNVTVVGTRLNPGLRVWVGGLVANVTRASADGTKLVFLAPSAPSDDWADQYRGFKLQNMDGGTTECPPLCSDVQQLVKVSSLQAVTLISAPRSTISTCVRIQPCGAAASTASRALEAQPVQEGSGCGQFRVWLHTKPQAAAH